MHVGFDATALEFHTTGAGEYQRNLLSALSRLDAGLRVTVYTPKGLGAHVPAALAAHEMPWRPGDSFTRIAFGGLFWQRRWRRDGLDVLHVPFYYLPPGAPARSVITIYDVRFTRLPGSYARPRAAFLRAAVPWSLRRARHIIAISEFTKREVVETLRVPPEKVTVIPLAPRLTFSELDDRGTLATVRARYRLPDHFILCVGTLEPHKNLPRVVEAFARLRQACVAHHLVLAGFDYFGGGAVLDTIARLGLSELVHRIGYVPDEDLPALYNLADLFVYPSLYEGFGIPPLEAMACGTPVVASAGTSIPEVVGPAALLVDPYDVAALADAMVEVLGNEQTAARLRLAGFERVRRFSWEDTARRTVAVYEAVASGRA